MSRIARGLKGFDDRLRAMGEGPRGERPMEVWILRHPVWWTVISGGSIAFLWFVGRLGDRRGPVRALAWGLVAGLLMAASTAAIQLPLMRRRAGQDVGNEAALVAALLLIIVAVVVGVAMYAAGMVALSVTIAIMLGSLGVIAIAVAGLIRTRRDRTPGA